MDFIWNIDELQEHIKLIHIPVVVVVAVDVVVAAVLGAAVFLNFKQI